MEGYGAPEREGGGVCCYVRIWGLAQGGGLLLWLHNDTTHVLMILSDHVGLNMSLTFYCCLGLPEQLPEGASVHLWKMTTMTNCVCITKACKSAFHCKVSYTWHIRQIQFETETVCMSWSFTLGYSDGYLLCEGCIGKNVQNAKTFCLCPRSARLN